jgi:hypothetical protein
MDIQLIPATVASVPEMSDCGCRAFENDELENAVFPNQPGALQGRKEYRIHSIRKRLQSPGWHYVLATIDSSEGPAKVVGYAGWKAPTPQGNDAEQNHAVEDDYYPEGIDMDVFKHANEVIEQAKKEVLGNEEHRVWSEFLTSPSHGFGPSNNQNENSP